MKRILFVHENDVLSELVCEILEMEGYRAVAASTAPRALELFHKQGFDIVITCSCVQGMDCLELAHAIHAEEPKLPVIVLTSHGTLEAGGDVQGCVAVDEGLFPTLVDKIRACLSEAEAKLREEEVRTVP